MKDPTEAVKPNIKIKQFRFLSNDFSFNSTGEFAGLTSGSNLTIYIRLKNPTIVVM
jgi:hypothetical protein